MTALLIGGTTALVIIATTAMGYLNIRAAHTPLGVSVLPYVNRQARYQVWLVGTAALVCAAAAALNPRNLRTFLAVDNLHAPASGVPFFGIAHGESWWSVAGDLAGVLGWLLARSVLETRGVALAWGIHFLQDIPIFLLLILADARDLAVKARSEDVGTSRAQGAGQTFT